MTSDDELLALRKEAAKKAEDRKAARVKGREDSEREKAVEHSRLLEIKADLEEMVETDSIVVEIPRKGKSPISLNFKKLTRKQVKIMMDSQAAMGTAGVDRDKAEQEADIIFRLIEEKSLDGITAEYLKEGSGFTADIINIMMISLLSGSSSPTKEYVEGLNKFRR